MTNMRMASIACGLLSGVFVATFNHSGMFVAAAIFGVFGVFASGYFAGRDR
jgi:hypothetical protein